MNCVLIPNGKDGKPSKFFQELANYASNRNEQILAYETTLKEEFLDWYNGELNDQGEPILHKGYYRNYFGNYLPAFIDGYANTIFSKYSSVESFIPFDEVAEKMKDSSPSPISNYAQLASNEDLERANKELDNFLLDFLKDFNVESEVINDFKARFGFDALGVADTLNKVIYLANTDLRNVETVPEEVAHMVVQLMGKHPDVISLLENINTWSEFPAIYQQYMPVYNNELQVRIEAVGKLIAKAIVRQNKLTGRDASLLRQALETIKKLLEIIKQTLNPDYFLQLENVSNRIAANILSKNKNYIVKDANDKMVKKEGKGVKRVPVDYIKSFEGNEFITAIRDDMMSIGLRLTGSAAISGQGEDIFRKPDEPVHDLDFVLPYGVDFSNTVDFIKSKYGAIKAAYIPGNYKDSYGFILTLPNYTIEPVYDKLNTVQKLLLQKAEREGDIHDEWYKRAKKASENPKLLDFKIYDESGKEVEPILGENYIGIDIFYNKVDLKLDVINGMSSWQDIYVGKQELSPLKEEERLFNRAKDQRDYVEMNPKNRERTRQSFMYYSLPVKPLYLKDISFISSPSPSSEHGSKNFMMETEKPYVEQLKKIFKDLGIDVNIIYDESITGLGEVRYNEDGSVTIILGKNFGSDTLLHEFSHIFIDLLGLEHPIVREVLAGLKKTLLWDKVRQLYKDKSLAIQEKELLAWAMGEKAAKMYGEKERNYFKYVWNRIVRAIQNLLGRNKSDVETLVRMMVDKDSYKGIGDAKSIIQTMAKEFGEAVKQQVIDINDAKPFIAQIGLEMKEFLKTQKDRFDFGTFTENDLLSMAKIINDVDPVTAMDTILDKSTKLLLSVNDNLQDIWNFRFSATEDDSKEIANRLFFISKLIDVLQTTYSITLKSNTGSSPSYTALVNKLNSLAANNNQLIKQAADLWMQSSQYYITNTILSLSNNPKYTGADVDEDSIKAMFGDFLDIDTINLLLDSARDSHDSLVALITKLDHYQNYVSSITIKNALNRWEQLYQNAPNKNFEEWLFDEYGRIYQEIPVELLEEEERLKLEVTLAETDFDRKQARKALNEFRRKHYEEEYLPEVYQLYEKHISKLNPADRAAYEQLTLDIEQIEERNKGKEIYEWTDVDIDAYENLKSLRKAMRATHKPIQDYFEERKIYYDEAVSDAELKTLFKERHDIALDLKNRNIITEEQYNKWLKHNASWGYGADEAERERNELIIKDHWKKVEQLKKTITDELEAIIKDPSVTIDDKQKAQKVLDNMEQIDQINAALDLEAEQSKYFDKDTNTLVYERLFNLDGTPVDADAEAFLNKYKTETEKVVILRNENNTILYGKLKLFNKVVNARTALKDYMESPDVAMNRKATVANEKFINDISTRPIDQNRMNSMLNVTVGKNTYVTINKFDTTESIGVIDRNTGNRTNYYKSIAEGFPYKRSYVKDIYKNPNYDVNKKKILKTSPYYAANKKYHDIINDPKKKQWYDEFMDLYDELTSKMHNKLAKEKYIFIIPTRNKTSMESMKEAFDVMYDESEREAKTPGLNIKGEYDWRFRYDFTQFLRKERYLDITGLTGQDRRDAILENQNIRKRNLKFQKERMSKDLNQVMTIGIPASLKINAKKEIEGIVRLAYAAMDGRGMIELNKKGFVKNMGKLTPLGIFSPKRKTGESNLKKSFENWMQRSFYNYTSSPSTKIFGFLDSNKIVDKMLWVQSMNGMALNPFAWFNSYMYGESAQWLEAFVGEYYTKSEYLKAQQIVATDSIKMMASLGKSNKTSVLRALDEQFGIFVTPEFMKAGNQISGGSYWDRAMDYMDHLYFGQHIQERMLQFQTMVAVLLNTKVRDVNGKDTNVWNSIELKNGVVTIKKGTQKKTLDKNGKEVWKEFTDKDMAAISGKVLKINQQIHGIYNMQDTGTYANNAFMRLMMQYRKWLRPGFNKRWRSTKKYRYIDPTTGKEFGGWHNEWLGHDMEGSYITLIDFMGKCLKQYKNLSAISQIYQNDMDAHQKANLKRALGEIVIMMVLFAMLQMMYAMDFDDPDESMASALLLYQTNRLFMEYSFYSVGMHQGYEILFNEPIPAGRSVELVSSILKQLAMFPFQDEEDWYYQSGSRKGELKLWVAINKFTPLLKTIDRFEHLDDYVRNHMSANGR